MVKYRHKFTNQYALAALSSWLEETDPLFKVLAEEAKGHHWSVHLEVNYEDSSLTYVLDDNEPVDKD